MKIAVIGSGIAGLACASRLAASGHEVVVFERADAVGGRIATLKTEVGGFDHGAQYLTARSAAFVAEVERWTGEGVVAPWAVTARNLDDRGCSMESGRTQRWVGLPGMAAIPAFLATGLDVRLGVRVTGIAPHTGGAGRWALACENVDGDATTTSEGPFDAVVVAIPAQAAVALLEAAPMLARQAGAARIEPCWALLLAFPESIAAHRAEAIGDAAFVDRGRLAWIARESSKPGRRLGERWTAHAQSAWSVEHFDDDPEDVKAKLLRAFHDATGTDEQPLWAQVHRWRYALSRSSLTCKYLWDAEGRIGACGDWCHGFRIEDAWLSGIALADAMR
jgi:renalase